jgi:hypothetical protein
MLSGRLSMSSPDAELHVEDVLDEDDVADDARGEDVGVDPLDAVELPLGLAARTATLLDVATSTPAGTRGRFGALPRDGAQLRIIWLSCNSA